MQKVELAIKFGSNEIIIYRKGEGIIAKEPVLLAVTPFCKKFRVKAIGTQAEVLQKNKVKNILVYQPIKNCEIQDVNLASKFIREILLSVLRDKMTITNISAIVAVPCAMSEEQLYKLRAVFNNAGVGKLKFVQNAVAVREYFDAIPLDKTCMVVDMGKYTLDISVLNGNSFIFGRDYSIGGFDMDRALVTYVEDNFNIEITDQLAESIKNEVGSLYENDSYSTKFEGINKDKEYQESTIRANEVRIAICGVYDKICRIIKECMDIQPKEVLTDIHNHGIIFTGGCAVIQGLYEYLIKKFDIPIIVVDNPTDAVILGAGKLIDKKDKNQLRIKF